MEVESAGPGRGSTFRFTIAAPAAEPLPAACAHRVAGEQPALRGRRLLVVDDNATNRRILTLQTARWGLQQRATGSPEEALQWLQAGDRYDLAIVDMHMPGMDGVELARRLRAIDPAMARVLFTSLGRREAPPDSEDGGEALFRATLAKPLRQSHLFDTLMALFAPAGDRSAAAPAASGVGASEAAGPSAGTAGAATATVTATATAGATGPDATLGERHPLRILLAEDNAVNQKLALRLLQRMGYRADVAANGVEAIEAVGRQTYDVVLMDVQMPEMDGLEASRRIAARWPAAARPRIVAMTANAMQGDREACLDAGMDDYVTKPIRVEQLADALRASPPRDRIDRSER